ncbi:unnamed protein product [Protopolystoma xenopodis]|uniref:Uncharacterized protein n=1 Tax=Protopolystoma xenopodis TaxID=117903 RepID=A0A448WYI3_9PLAT|nr:unnamed protein product [Protopolystoma xenopodis]
MCNKNIADRIYSKAFHELSAYQRVVLIRALVESTLRAFDNLRASLDRWADWEASRPVELGYDPTDGIVYLRFPSLIDAEICTPCRIYSLPRPQAEFTFPPTWPNETQPTEALSTRTPINELALAEDNLESKDEEIGSQGQTKRRRYKRYLQRS